ncbi:hypothetical protein [Kitasatospora sp. NPDC090308]|uniref:hypothetical protein n=1 Tax=Kitasatospora sp. NPDC090308 TaxID=3364082 RepID=UPI00380FD9DD
MVRQGPGAAAREGHGQPDDDRHRRRPRPDEFDLTVLPTLPNGRRAQVRERAGDGSAREVPPDAAALTRTATAAPRQRAFDGLDAAPLLAPDRPGSAGDRMLAALTPLLGGARPDTGRTATDLPGRIRADVSVDGRTSVPLLTATPGPAAQLPDRPDHRLPSLHPRQRPGRVRRRPPGRRPAPRRHPGRPAAVELHHRPPPRDARHPRPGGHLSRTAGPGAVAVSGPPSR